MLRNMIKFLEYEIYDSNKYINKHSKNIYSFKNKNSDFKKKFWKNNSKKLSKKNCIKFEFEKSIIWKHKQIIFYFFIYYIYIESNSFDS